MLLAIVSNVGQILKGLVSDPEEVDDSVLSDIIQDLMSAEGVEPPALHGSLLQDPVMQDPLFQDPCSSTHSLALPLTKKSQVEGKLEYLPQW